MRRTRLVFAPADPQAAPAYLLLDAFGDVVGRGEQPVTAGAPDTATAIVLVVPGVDAVARWLQLPTRSDAQARAAAALMLADETAFADEPLHVAVGPLEDDGHRLVVAMAESRLRAWLDLARIHGLPVERVVPEYMLLPELEDGTPVAVRIGDLVAVRGRRLALACEPDLLATLLQPPPAVAEGEAAERLLAEGATRPGIDLRQGPFAPADGQRPGRRDIVRAAALAGVLLLSPILLNAAEAVRLNLAADRLERAPRRVSPRSSRRGRRSPIPPPRPTPPCSGPSLAQAAAPRASPPSSSRRWPASTRPRRRA
ncbi:type II secretion system protein GspL [Phenylobacterium sp. J367]|uniref:type II secretion system protein GspL n=1 Tax=Phenylobacterium sp. J367 TaxID=2898435 RepID=UPI002150CA66|nr:type II secretion system protein GspL [Phenylobacterium sp. J367]MCR5881091.1 type II secretion system protein GspL [Phenylobacterium sp. J367]